jgi:DnaJ-class molecular chaperone
MSDRAEPTAAKGQLELLPRKTTCPNCHGTGQTRFGDCAYCKGTGHTTPRRSSQKSVLPGATWAEIFEPKT